MEKFYSFPFRAWLIDLRTKITVLQLSGKQHTQDDLWEQNWYFWYIWSEKQKGKIKLTYQPDFFFPSASFCSRDIGDYFGFQTKKYMFVFFKKKLFFRQHNTAVLGIKIKGFQPFAGCIEEALSSGSKTCDYTVFNTRAVHYWIIQKNKLD